MTRIEVERLRRSLATEIEDWWANGEFDRSRLPAVGDNICDIMAAAAIAVLEGVADLEIYLRESGELKDEED